MSQTPSYTIGKLVGDDLAHLAKIYSSAIRHIGPAYYTPEQVNAWSNFANDATRFRDWVTQAETLVARDVSKQAIGFAGLADKGHIAALFVAPDYQRKGIASSLLEQLLQRSQAYGCPTQTTKASEFSKPLFERFGFTVVEIEHTLVDEVAFSRYAMKRNNHSAQQR